MNADRCYSALKSMLLIARWVRRDKMIINTSNLTNILDRENNEVWQRKDVSLDTKVICHWLYLICKIMLVLRGVG